jgi:hypothetical protein
MEEIDGGIPRDRAPTVQRGILRPARRLQTSGIDSFRFCNRPRLGDVNVDDLVDSRFIRKLDESGFFDRIYGNAAR